MRTIITSKTDKGEEALIKLSKEKIPSMFKLMTATIKVIKKIPLTVEINNKALKRTFKLARISPKKVLKNSQYISMIIEHTEKNILSKYNTTRKDFNIEVKE